MDVVLKLLAIALTIILGLLPTFFNLIIPADTNPNLAFYQRVTNSGWIAFIGAGICLCIYIYLEIKDNNDKNALKASIGNIETALQKEGLQYDSTRRVITTINGNQNTVSQSNGGHIGTVMGANSQAIGHTYSDNKIITKPNADAGVRIGITLPDNSVSIGARVVNNTVNRNSSNSLLGLSYALKEYARMHNLPDDKVELIAVEGTNGESHLPTFKRLLAELGIDATVMPFPVPPEEIRKIQPSFNPEIENDVIMGYKENILTLLVGNINESPAKRP